MPSLYGTYGQPTKLKKKKKPKLTSAPQVTLATTTTEPKRRAARSSVRSTQAQKPSENSIATKRVKRRTTKKLRSKTRTGLDAFDRKYKPGEQISEDDFARVVETVGEGQLPGKAYAQVAIGESNLTPTADREKTHPSDPGKGVLQMTAHVQSPSTVKKWDQIASEHKGGVFNPVANARMAKYLAGSGDGLSNYYGDQYVTDPTAHAKPFKEVPKLGKKFKRKAVDVLGKKKVKKIVNRNEPKDKVLPGPYMGSQRAVLKALPKAIRDEGRNDKRDPAENDKVGGSKSSDHLTTNESTYASDIPGTLEDGHTDDEAKKIAKRLGMKGHRGTNTVVKDGYRYRLIWQAKGHYNHIHLGADRVDAPNSAPTSSGGGSSSPTTGGVRATGGVRRKLKPRKKRKLYSDDGYYKLSSKPESDEEEELELEELAAELGVRLS